MVAAIARRLAALTGVESVLLAPSTLHGFWDFFGTIQAKNTAALLDAGAYSMARWGVEHAAARGAAFHRVSHFDAKAVGEVLATRVPERFKPILVADGFCPGCGRSAPISEYMGHLRRRNGLLILDDTQALGILGHSPGRSAPFGLGGGGSLQYQKTSGPDILLISSLAKGFGVPMAMLGGSSDWIKRLEMDGGTRVHSSPPSNADLHAGEAALNANDSRGEMLRLRLAHLIRRWRSGLLDLGLRLNPTLFPVQSVVGEERWVFDLHRRLSAQGIQTVLQRPACRNGPVVTLVLTARHTEAEVSRAVTAIGRALNGEPAPVSPVASTGP
jgi:8-amino-7-oxononanoate synthase